MNFKDIKLNETFHRGISFGIGAHSKTKMVIIHKKISKSRALIVNTLGFGNTSQIGGLVPLAWCEPVTPCSSNFNFNN